MAAKVNEGRTVAVASIVILALLLCGYLVYAALGKSTTNVNKTPGVQSLGLSLNGGLGGANDSPTDTSVGGGDGSGAPANVWNAPNGGMITYLQSDGLTNAHLDTMYSDAIAQGKTPSQAVTDLIDYVGSIEGTGSDVTVSVTQQ